MNQEQRDKLLQALKLIAEVRAVVESTNAKLVLEEVEDIFTAEFDLQSE